MNANPSPSIQQAMDQASQMVIDVYAHFERLRRQLLSWEADIDAQIEKFVDGMGKLLRGNLRWSFETPRYFGSEREEVKRTKCIKLLPPKTTVQKNIIHSEKDAKISSISHKDKHNVYQLNGSQNHLVELHKEQGYDIWWQDNNICPTEENYHKMIDSKCGGRFHLTLDLLRIYSPINLTEEKTKAINDICQTFGLFFFQIRDDYCNLISMEYSQNKTFCEDLTEGKYSFPIIHAIQNRPNDNRIQNILK
ncbi:unnamed protein product [Adineta steineri]|uniref:Uncharacterized protein n=1 Tax=Adineta steineri TaxID=433720 RepID=A0A815IMS7_9BILA|nr:unnamed protein product [Adineta steineri]